MTGPGGPERKDRAASTLLARLDALEARFAEVEPRVRAFVPEEGRFERLRSQAQALTERFPEPSRRLSLFGVLVGVKDIFHLDGFPTRAGSELPPEELAGEEGPVVRALRDAGALFVGKTATTEFAYFAPAVTENPHRPGHTPGGSSSGSAAAVAAGLCELALGTQTIGSVIRPAAFCGVAGLKPSFDRLSRDGVIPLAPSLDHVGLFAPDLTGLARAAAVLIPDWQAVEISESEGTLPVLGVPVGPYLDRAATEGLDHFRAVVARLRARGFQVKEIPAFADFEAIESRHRRLMAFEAARVHRRWFARYGERYHPKTAELIREGQTVGSEEADAARAARGVLRSQLQDLMDRHGVELWICPPARGAAPAGLASTGDPVMDLPWTQAGMPAVNLPVERNREGLPLGLQGVGRYGEDEALLAAMVTLAPHVVP